MSDDAHRFLPARAAHRPPSRTGRPRSEGPDLRVLPGGAVGGTPESGGPRRLRVLLVEPDGATRDRLRPLLEPLVELVGEAEDGHRALAMVARCRPDVVIMSLHLPRLGGLETLQLLAETHPEVHPVVHSAERNVDLVRQAMVAGARDFLVEPVACEELVAALGRAARLRSSRERLRERGDGPPGAGIWCFASPGGGAGRTTLLLSLAHELAARGHRVAAVDLDLYFGDLAFYLGMDRGAPGFAELVAEPHLLERAVLEAHLRPHASGIRILTGPADVLEASTLDKERCVLATLGLPRVVDYVLVDLPPGLADVTVPVLDEARYVFATADGSIASLKNMRSFAALLAELGYPAEKVHPILTRLAPAARSRKDFDTILSKVGSGISEVLPRDPVTVERAVLAGQPVPARAPDCEYARAIRRLASRLLGCEAEAKAPRRRGLLGRLLG